MSTAAHVYAATARNPCPALHLSRWRAGSRCHRRVLARRPPMATNGRCCRRRRNRARASVRSMQRSCAPSVSTSTRFSPRPAGIVAETPRRSRPRSQRRCTRPRRRKHRLKPSCRNPGASSQCVPRRSSPDQPAQDTAISRRATLAAFVAATRGPDRHRWGGHAARLDRDRPCAAEAGTQRCGRCLAGCCQWLKFPSSGAGCAAASRRGRRTIECRCHSESAAHTDLEACCRRHTYSR
ncbi:hypothetical protein B7760_01624 [Burkholderia glumae]|nr:hypothetical protein B7760_01624 [Burkholderia glumae]